MRSEWKNGETKIDVYSGAICLIVLVAGFAYSNWSIDNTDDITQDSTTDDTSSSTSTNGLYQVGTYTGGTVYGSFTLS